MDRKMKKALRNYQRREEGIHIIVSPKEFQLLKESVEYNMKHNVDEMLLFEYQMLLDDMDEIQANREGRT